jgi:hypothetical protein
MGFLEDALFPQQNLTKCLNQILKISDFFKQIFQNIFSKEGRIFPKGCLEEGPFPRPKRFYEFFKIFLLTSEEGAIFPKGSLEDAPLSSLLQLGHWDVLYPSSF